MGGSIAALWVCGGLVLTATLRVEAQWFRQSLALRPGWNAVYLEVQPEPADCDVLFAGLPVESVWDYNPPVEGAQFVQDPSELIPGAPGWLTWFPPGHPLASETSLFILRDGRPYLIKLADGAPATTWTVTGVPSLRGVRWRAGAVNLVGFHAGGSASPSFEALFAGEAGLAGQPVFRLNTDGRWLAVSDSRTGGPLPGEAYWVRCAAPAERSGTIEVDAGGPGGLQFGAAATELGLRVRNTSTAPRAISVRLLESAAPPDGQPPSAGPVPLEYYEADYAAAEFEWKPMAAPVGFAALAPGAEWNLRLGVRRAAAPAAGVPGAVHQSLLEVSDDAGTRWIVPVSAEPAGAAAGSRLRTSAGSGAGAGRHAGLWVGDAVLNAVSQPARVSGPEETRAAGSEFSFRLIVHVGADGQARLLQHVFLVRKPPVTAPDPENPGFERVVEPARTVIVTDEDRIAVLTGGGEIAGRRLSTAAFAFDVPVPLSGGDTFGEGAHSATVRLDYRSPRNPFRHAFHPDHDNLDERFENVLPEGRESFSVSRVLTLDFTADDPVGLNPPGWGDTEIGGRYREVLAGLHRHPIHVSGYFVLTRVSSVAELNDGRTASQARVARTAR